jgi:hypothetical protein
VRETLEESEIECEVTGIAGSYSDPKEVILCTSNGEVRQEFSIAATARALSSQPAPAASRARSAGYQLSEIPGT